MRVVRQTKHEHSRLLASECAPVEQFNIVYNTTRIIKSFRIVQILILQLSQKSRPENAFPARNSAFITPSGRATCFGGGTDARHSFPQKSREPTKITYPYNYVKQPHRQF